MSVQTADNVEQTIQHSFDRQAVHPYSPLQVDVIDNQYFEQFQRYLHSICDYCFIDKLDCRISTARESTDLDLDDVVDKASSGIACGIKINYNSQIKVQEWDHWEGGYIEGFIRIPGKQVDYFIWTYVKVEYLRQILEKWGQYMNYYLLE